MHQERESAGVGNAHCVAAGAARADADRVDTERELCNTIGVVDSSSMDREPRCWPDYRPRNGFSLSSNGRVCWHGMGLRADYRMLMILAMLGVPLVLRANSM